MGAKLQHYEITKEKYIIKLQLISVDNSYSNSTLYAKIHSCCIVGRDE